jgi:hypothetical protein
MHMLHLVDETGVGLVSTFEHTSLVMALGCKTDLCLGMMQV